MVKKKNIRIFAFGGNEVAPVGIKDANGKSINPGIAMQWQRTNKTCKEIANVIEKFPDDEYIITHGNGPQVGNVLLRAEYSRSILPNLPLDVCGADTQGAMGYMISKLGEELRIRGINKFVDSIVTQVVVDEDDTAFQNPTKYVGPPYTKAEADERMKNNGWVMKVYKRDEQGNEIWRRVVPSPVPLDVVEKSGIMSLLDADIIPITVGGGGIPVVEVKPEIVGDEEIYECNYGIKYTRPYKKGTAPVKIYKGVDAVIDKDYASSLLGRLLVKMYKERGYDVEITLTIFTGVDGAKLNFQQPDEKSIRHITASELEKIYNQDPCPFYTGSMGPKIKAIIDFLHGGGDKAYISLTNKFYETIGGTAGTTVVKD